MVPLKTPEEIVIMREGGKISAKALKEVIANVRVGITTLELDSIADNVFTASGASAAFKRVRGYKHATCININEGLVHGIPNSYKIKQGDLVKIDLGAFYKGFNTDMSYTVEVETTKHTKFLEAGKESLANAIKKAVIGNKIGDISAAMQAPIESNGYTVSRDLIGHGVGRNIHEPPAVPGYGRPNTGLELKEGMVLALEIIYQKGKPELVYEKDGWTLSTADRSLAGLFEHTVAIVPNGPLILTLE